MRDCPALEQLLEHERVIVTPHLGASTEEAQVRVAIDIAQQIVHALRLGADFVSTERRLQPMTIATTRR